MDTNEQFQQPDVTLRAGIPFNTAEEQDAEKSSRPAEKGAEMNLSEASRAQSTGTGALVKVLPKELANKFASFDTAQTKKAFADLGDEIRDIAEACTRACKDAVEGWKALVPYLSQMQSLLSQRGEKRQEVLREAELPTWTAWVETFKEDIGLKPSLRTVQKNIAKLREKSPGGKTKKAVGVGRSPKKVSETVLYKIGYQNGEAATQVRVDTPTKDESILKARVADLDKENQQLLGNTRQLQDQHDKDEANESAKRLPKPAALKEFLELAEEAFEIINGNYGECLIANPDGKRLVAIAKKAGAVKTKLKIC